MKDKIEFIRQKAIEANPSIKDLVFGCELKNKLHGENAGAFITKTPYLFGKIGLIYQLHDGDWSSVGEDQDQIVMKYEIIGRPIRLADVLLAVQGMKLKQVFFVDQEGGFGTALAGQNPKLFSILKGWDLKNDDLEKQSEETIDFLYDLLSGSAKES